MMLPLSCKKVARRNDEAARCGWMRLDDEMSVQRGIAEKGEGTRRASFGNVAHRAKRRYPDTENGFAGASSPVAAGG